MFGRTRKQVASPDAATLDDALVAQMRHAASDGFTGALDVSERAFDGQASLYFFRGGLYSAAIEGWEPRTIQRLVSSAALAGFEAAALASEQHAEARLVDSGSVPIDAVATIHQEMLLASVGAILHARLGRARRRQGAVTDVGCTLPLPVEDVLTSVSLRSRRMADTWRLVSSGATPAHLVLGQSAPSNQVPASPPELLALHGQLNGECTLDEAAWNCGFTRAEAVHLSASLVTAGLAAVVSEGASPAAHQLLVPEAFGEYAPAGEAVIDLVVPPESSRDPRPTFQVEAVGAGELAVLEEELEQALRDQQAAADRVADVRRRLDQAQAAMRMSSS